MRAISVFVLILTCFAVTPAMGQSSSAGERIAPSRRAVSSALPNDLRFERNVGQTDARVAYLARGGRNSIFLTNSEVVLAFGESQSDSLRMRCTGASPDARLSAEIELPGTVNYLHGGDPESWKRGLPTFARVRYQDIYPGIDVLYSGHQQRLVSEFEIAPGADATQIQLQFAGSTGLVVDEQGDLEVAMNGGTILQRRALVRQIGGVAKQSVPVRYDRVGADEVTIEVGEYDRTAALVVTVITDFTASLGSASAQDWCEGIALDAAGNIYVTGRTLAHDFPGSAGAAISTYAGQTDAFVSKLTPSADTILFSSYIGGNYIDSGVDIAVDATGAVYVLGETRSENFVTTPGAYDRVLNVSGGSNPDLFLAKFSPSGDTVVYSTFLGGGDYESAGGIAVDASGAVSVCGVTDSDDFPVTPGAFDATRGSGTDAFVTKLNSTGSALNFSTFLGGTGDDEAWDLVLNASGNALVTGRTSSPEYPTTPGAFDRTYSGGDSFVTMLAANGATLSMSTFLGPDSTGQRIALGSGGTIYVAGETDAPSFPTTAGAYDRTFNGLQDMFALKLSATGSSLVFSTFVGGVATESLRGLAVDSAGAMHLSGYVNVGGFPTTPGSHDQSFNDGHFDSVAAKLSPTGAALVYGTYLGGAGLDRGYGVAIATNGEAIYIGETEAAGFPRVGGLDLPEDFPNGYVTRLTSTLGTVVFSSFIGGVTGEGGVDTGRAIAVDSGGFIYITGAAAEPSFPTTAGAADTVFGSDYRLKEAYVTKIAPGGASLVYSTFLGGDGDDVGAAIQVDDAGIVTVAGDTCSVDFPETPGAYNPAYGGCDIFAVRLSADGSSVLYATTFGGSSIEYCRGLGIDDSGSIFLAGETWSSNFPTVAGAIDTTLGGPIDGFLARISSDGTSLVYGTYVGGMGTDRVNSLAVDGAGVATITGNTGGDFPVTAGAFDTTFNGGGDYGYDGFVARTNPQGNQLVYSTYLGGTNDDYLNGIAIDATGAAYVTGAASADYPSVGPQPSPPSGASIVTKIAADGASLVYSTRIAGGTEGTAIAVDADGSVATTGYASTFFVTTPGAYQTQLAGQYDAYVARLHPSGASLEYATLFGGTEYDYGRGIAIGAGGAMYAVGDVVGEGFVPVTFGYGGRNAIFVIAVGAEQIGGATTAGVYLPSTGTWFLKNAHSGGAADQAFSFGPGGAGLVAVDGDWNGNGDDTAGLYDPLSGFFFLKSTNAAGAADLVFGFGPGSAGFLPLIGDWNGDGLDTVGLYDPSTGVFFLKNSNTSGPADVVAGFGPAIAGWVPLVGDWNGDAVDSVGLYSPSNGFFFLRNVNAPGPADLVFGYGAGGAGIVPLVGDWDSDGIDTVGLYAEGTGTFFLRNSNSGGPANFVYGFGPTGVRPIVGDWDGL